MDECMDGWMDGWMGLSLVFEKEYIPKKHFLSP
jgi:hypothetical protein